MAALVISNPVWAELPDISTVKPDLAVPDLSEKPPGAGRRVKAVLPGYEGTGVYHLLYLPSDWLPGRRYPVLVEYAGNGPYRDRNRDVSSGRVEGSRMGYGISGGERYIWLCLPYLDGEGRANVRRWWGSKPEHDPQPTVNYCRQAVKHICSEFGGDQERLVLCGFSRGAIACNFIGLHDDQVASLWKAFVPYSHYDGVRRWGYPGSDRAAALGRLRRLGPRPQFVCSGGSQFKETARFLAEAGVKGNFTFRGTGFRNHSDAWLLRPSPVRRELRSWLARVLK
ncbi:MAG: hypothetical protein CMP27_15025 [Roseibacillus sp.]|nr:hypothetical protein [Roseibacillus sp.]